MVKRVGLSLNSKMASRIDFIAPRRLGTGRADEISAFRIFGVMAFMSIATPAGLASGPEPRIFSSDFLKNADL